MSSVFYIGDQTYYNRNDSRIPSGIYYRLRTWYRTGWLGIIPICSFDGMFQTKKQAEQHFDKLKSIKGLWKHPLRYSITECKVKNKNERLPYKKVDPEPKVYPRIETSNYSYNSSRGQTNNNSYRSQSNYTSSASRSSNNGLSMATSIALADSCDYSCGDSCGDSCDD
jgi:hypothetical protein